MKLLCILASLCLSVSHIRAAEICCPDIGCFTDDAPYDGQPLPQCLSSMDPPPVYTMYTRSNPTNGQVFDHTSVPSYYHGGRRTVFIAHGWQSSGDAQWLTDIKEALLDREDVNAVIADWRGGAEYLLYPQSAANTRSVGAYTALVFANLVSSGGSASRTWCMGHSLGAHMCGHAGMKTQLERVTGMDPAGPWFEGSPDWTVGLNPTSANFVDVIHTDNVLGTLRNLGHIDFYPNGGRAQPGCGVGNSCDHGRAHDYMLHSIPNDCFLARSKCTDYDDLENTCSSCTCGSSPCAVMGYGAENGCEKSGYFYLTTDTLAPFCEG